MDALNFSTFGKFSSKEEALELTGLLEKNNIKYLLEDYSVGFSPVFGKDKIADEYRVSIGEEDFKRVDLLLQEKMDSRLEETEKTYYLFDFTNQELTELVERGDEWSRSDVELAKSILKERGKELDLPTLNSMKQQRTAQLAEPEKLNEAWIYLGYLMAVLGGLMGLFIGLQLKNYKKKLPDGTYQFGYDQRIRQHGNRIWIISMVTLVLALIYNLTNKFS